MQSNNVAILRRQRRSIRSYPRHPQDQGNGLYQDGEVLSKRPVVHIIAFGSKLLFECDAMVAVYLPWSCNALRHCKAAEQLLLHPVTLSRQDRTRADETHITANNVDQLRQFINERTAEQPTNPSDPRISADFEERTTCFVKVQEILKQDISIGYHRAELIEGELETVLSQSSLLVQDWSRAADFDR